MLCRDVPPPITVEATSGTFLFFVRDSVWVLASKTNFIDPSVHLVPILKWCPSPRFRPGTS